MTVTVKKGPKKAPAAKAAAQAVTSKETTSGLSSEEHEQVSHIESPLPHSAMVTVSMGMTRKLADYESFKFTVGISIPCHPDHVDETYAAGKEWVEERVNSINDEVQQMTSP